jgi:hypothetical protein
MAIMRVMQVAIDKVVDMVTMRYCWMPAVRAVNMGSFMATANVATRALVWVGCVNVERVFFDNASGFLMVQMPIMKKIDMVSVLDGGMPAVFAVNVGMIFV